MFLNKLLDGTTVQVKQTLEGDPKLLHRVCLLFAHSSWLGGTLIRNHDLLQRISNEEQLRRSLSREEFRAEFARLYARTIGTDVASVLARFRKREYVRILLRDILGIAGLSEITEEISALADVLLGEALAAMNSKLTRELGRPRCVDAQGREREPRFAVVSLGKLGGSELNYSSDVDLMFLYEAGIERPASRVSNREYFIQLAQNLTELLSRRTREGQVFRIDLRLRPQGHEGEVAVALPHAIRYYSELAEDWELQAMIKARHSAGDESLTQEFVCSVAPFVYRPNVNFAAVKTALRSRERIDRRGRVAMHGRSAGAAIDVKLDHGGIRDIEFLVQCLQRVYGGDERWLRSRGTLFALQKLHDKEHIGGRDFHSLTKTYEFLRSLEHQLQIRSGQQIHTLPQDAEELGVLASCFGWPDKTELPAQEFLAQVRTRMAVVAEIYRRVVYREQSNQFIDGDGNLRLQWETGPTAENSYSQMMQRLMVDAPKLLAHLARADMSQLGRRNLERFLNSASTSSERYAAVLRSPDAVERAVALFDTSEYLSELLIRHPADVGLLTEIGQAEATATSEMFPAANYAEASATDPILAYLATNAMERKQSFALLRREFRREMMLANAPALYCSRPIWEIFEANSRSTERALTYAYAISGAPRQLAILTLGRLGSSEFDLLSDADILFVAADGSDLDECRAAAQRIMESLTAYTKEGTVFPVDARLRPRGNEGELVTTPDRLVRYFSNEAKAWEAITYLRLRWVTGSHETGEAAARAVEHGISEVSRQPGFADELHDMRQRLELSDPEPNLKTGPGGTYDIDFLAGRLQATHGIWSNGNLAARVEVLQKNGYINPDDGEELAKNAAFLRSIEHYVRLVTGRAIKWLPASQHPRGSVARLAGLQPESTEEQLLSVMQRTRELYRKYGF